MLGRKMAGMLADTCLPGMRCSEDHWDAFESDMTRKAAASICCDAGMPRL